MIIPFSTDAPIYHFPKATLGVIASNVVVHVAWSLASPDAAEPYAMKLGAGLHPLQWLTHNFLHADFVHLGFNMIFLWAYGIIVEGKIGWLPFLLSYLSIGTIHGAAIQLAYLHTETPAYVLGASGIIFGLMAISMIWAPVNDLSCFYLFFVGLRAISNVVEVPIYVFALLQLSLEGLSVLLMYMMHGDPMSSGLLHISGAFWGLIVGILLLKAGWVDCEGWDVFSLREKRRALRKAWKAREARLDRSKENEKLSRAMLSEEDRPGLSPEERAAKLLKKVHRSIESGDMAAAQAAYEKWIGVVGNRGPPRCSGRSDQGNARTRGMGGVGPPDACPLPSASQEVREGPAETRVHPHPRDGPPDGGSPAPPADPRGPTGQFPATDPANAPPGSESDDRGWSIGSGGGCVRCVWLRPMARAVSLAMASNIRRIGQATPSRKCLPGSREAFTSSFMKTCSHLGKT